MENRNKVELLYSKGMSIHKVTRMTGITIEEVRDYITPELKEEHDYMLKRRQQLTNKLLNEWDHTIRDIKNKRAA